jgi:hypothetical protein
MFEALVEVLLELLCFSTIALAKLDFSGSYEQDRYYGELVA